MKNETKTYKLQTNMSLKTYKHKQKKKTLKGKNKKKKH